MSVLRFVSGIPWGLFLGPVAPGQGSRFADLHWMVPPDSGFPDPIVLGDLDGDGDRDPIVGGRLWLNQGTGSFVDASSQFPPTPGGFSSFALGDGDGDGDVDVFVGTTGQNRHWLNDGAGTFADATTQLPAPVDTTSAVALGDVDADGDLDAFAANMGSETLLLNDGAGNFSDASGFLPPANDPSYAVALGDVDADGDIDAFVGNGGCSLYGAPDPPRLLLNDGTGAFSDASGQLPSLFQNPDTQAVAIGDLDGDADLDLVLGNHMGGGFCGLASAGEDHVYWNDGAGGFTLGTFSNSYTLTRGVALADADGDGDVDAFFGNASDCGPPGESFCIYGSYVFYRNEGGTVFTGPFPLTGTTGLGASFDVGDVDGDGDVDLLAARLGGHTRLYLNDGSGAYSDVSGAGAIQAPQESAVALADFDGDGDIDALTAHFEYPYSSPIRLYRNDGSGLFANTPAELAGPGVPVPTTIASGDLDGDGDLDAVVGSQLSCSSFPYASQVLFNSGVGTFTSVPTLLPAGEVGTGDLALADVDGDGDLDLLLGNGGSGSPAEQDRLYLNDGLAVFSDATGQLPATLGVTLVVTLGDADGDGDLDACLAGTTGSHRLYQNDGTGTFLDSSAALPPSTSWIHSAVWRDVDGDGDADLALVEEGYGWGRLRILSNLARQVTRRAVPRVGKPLTLDLYGPAWGAWFLGASPGTGLLPIPPLGSLRLDPATLIVVHAGLLNGEGRASPTYSVPPAASLVGASVYWQAVLVGPAALTNLEATTITAL